MAKRWWHRRWVIVLAVIAGTGLVVSLSASRVVGYFFEKRVAKVLQEKAHARVSFGGVLYAPPYSFYARDVQVTVPKEEGSEAQRFAAGSVSIRLDHFPRRGEPISIESLVVHHAMINIGDRAQRVELDRVAMSVRETSDRKGFEGSVMVGDSPAGSVSAEGRLDLGEKQLRLEKIAGAVRVAPLLARLTLPATAYPAVDLASPDGKVSVSGWATVPFRDVDHSDYQLTVDLEGVSAKVPKLKAKLSEGKSRIVLRPSGVSPGAVEATFESLDVASNKGKLSLGGAVAVARLREKVWELSQAVGTVTIGNELPVFLPHSGWFFNEGQFNGPLRFTLAASGPFDLRGKDPFQAIRHEVLAYPRDFSLRPKNFVFPIDHINGGPIALRGGVVSFQNLTGTYGKDKLLLRNARLVLEDPVRRIAVEDLRTQVKFEEIAGTVVFDRTSPPYPGVVGKTVTSLQPEGPFVIGGGSWFAINRPPRYEPWVKFKPDFYIKLAGDGGSFAVKPYNVPLSEIQGQAKIAPMSVEISGFRAKSLGGEAWADGQIVPGKPFLYNGKIDVRDADMSALAQLIPVNDSVKQRLTGTAGVSMHVAGTGKGGPKPPLATLIADGEWEILHGDFWSVPAVKNVASHVRKPEELGTGDAAGVMHLENNKITLDNAAISSPLLGLQGHGTIGFDKTLDLTVVAAPLGDWRDRMKQTGVPVVGDLAGGVQQLLNAAQGTLLFQYKVTGSVGHPEEAMIPVPVVTEPVAYLFGQMARQDTKADLLGEVKKQSPETAGKAEQGAGQPQPAGARQAGVK